MIGPVERMRGAHRRSVSAEAAPHSPAASATGSRSRGGCAPTNAAHPNSKDSSATQPRRRSHSRPTIGLGRAVRRRFRPVGSNFTLVGEFRVSGQGLTGEEGSIVLISRGSVVLRAMELRRLHSSRSVTRPCDTMSTARFRVGTLRRCRWISHGHARAHQAGVSPAVSGPTSSALSRDGVASRHRNATDGPGQMLDQLRQRVLARYDALSAGPIRGPALPPVVQRCRRCL